MSDTAAARPSRRRRGRRRRRVRAHPAFARPPPGGRRGGRAAGVLPRFSHPPRPALRAVVGQSRSTSAAPAPSSATAGAVSGLENRYVRVSGLPDRESALQIDTKGSWVFSQFFRDAGDRRPAVRPPAREPAAGVAGRVGHLRGAAHPRRRSVVRRLDPQLLRHARRGHALLRARRAVARARRSAPRRAAVAASTRSGDPRVAGRARDDRHRRRRARAGADRPAARQVRHRGRRARGAHRARRRGGAARSARSRPRPPAPARGGPALVDGRAGSALDVRGEVPGGRGAGRARRDRQPRLSDVEIRDARQTVEVKLEDVSPSGDARGGLVIRPRPGRPATLAAAGRSPPSTPWRRW